MADTVLGSSALAGKAAFYGVIACWWLFALTFWLRKHPPRAREAKRDLRSYLGLGLQALAYGMVWMGPMQHGSIFVPERSPAWFAWAVTGATLVIAIASVGLVNAAARRLGKQWSLGARVVEGHDLIQDGPYRVVRNPIYTGMLGMLVATGLAVDRWIPLSVAIVVFLIGTVIRVGIEERLLRETFGQQFDDYARRVPSLIPGVY